MGALSLDNMGCFVHGLELCTEDRQLNEAGWAEQDLLGRGQWPLNYNLVVGAQGIWGPTGPRPRETRRPPGHAGPT